MNMADRGSYSRFRNGFMVLALLGLLFSTAGRSYGAVTSVTFDGEAVDAFDGMLSSSDLIHGKNTLDVDVYENPADSFGNPSGVGWHPANNAPEDQLAAFTDGQGMLNPGTGLTGLLNDFPGANNPAKIVQYPFDSPVDIGRINILTGNRNDADGRVFSATYIEYSTDNGFTFQGLGYFQSDPSGAANTTFRSKLVSVFDNSDSVMLSGVTDIIFNLYSVSNNANQMRDAFDGVNPFTNVDDTFDAAFQSPLVLEIDVLPPSEGLDGDFNHNGIVDAADYVLWRKTDNSPGQYELWRANFGRSEFGAGQSSGIPGVPEPATVLLLLVAFSALVIPGSRSR